MIKTPDPKAAHRASNGQMPAQGAPTLRETTFDDYPQIAALLKRNGLGTRSREEWVHLWAGNPAYEHGRTPLGWVLETSLGEVVGSLGSIPLAYEIEGKPVRTAAASDWAVDHPCRARSLLLLHKFTNQPGPDFLICTTVSPNSEPGYRAFRWSKAPGGTWNTSSFWVTGFRGFARSAMITKRVPLPRLLSWPAGAALGLASAFERRRRPEDSLADIEVLTGFDSRFDEFWLEYRYQNRDKLLAVRDRMNLEWHFKHALLQRSLFILTAVRGTRVTGYAIVQRHDNDALRLKCMRVVEVLTLPDHESAVPALLRRALQKCRADGIHIMECPGSWLRRYALPPSVAPRERDIRAWTHYYRTKDERLAHAVNTPELWTPSLYDGDASL